MVRNTAWAWWASLAIAAAATLATSALAAQVNINTADAATLSRELKGIGAKRAQAIVEYRQKYGAFKSADELALIKGIGPAAIARNRDLILTAPRAERKTLPTVPATVQPSPARKR
jgi:competence protein ComEA